MKVLIKALILILGLANPLLAEEVILPAVNGMTLEFGDFVQQAKVRAKSLGTGACSVTFKIDDVSNGFLAPPLDWSSWTKIGPAFLGPSTQKLGFDVGCDTGAIAQIKYQK